MFFETATLRELSGMGLLDFYEFSDVLGDPPTDMKSFTLLHNSILDYITFMKRPGILIDILKYHSTFSLLLLYMHIPKHL